MTENILFMISLYRCIIEEGEYLFIRAKRLRTENIESYIKADKRVSRINGKKAE